MRAAMLTFLLGYLVTGCGGASTIDKCDQHISACAPGSPQDLCAALDEQQMDSVLQLSCAEVAQLFTAGKGDSILNVNRAAGAACLFTFQCAKGLTCVDAWGEKTCRNPVGGACSDASQCELNVACIEGKCGGTPVPVGSACGHDTDCETHFCWIVDHTCRVSNCPIGADTFCAGIAAVGTCDVGILTKVEPCSSNEHCRYEAGSYGCY